jgi:uncharacterized LabA/DUF88 family protein
MDPNVSRVAILIDGSNFLAELDRCGLSYPALGPLISWIQGTDELVYARFYSAPQLLEPFQSRWQAFRAANRHIAGLDFFQGYRDKANREKVIDVALAVDLIYGCAYDHFDRVAIVGGDADHHYAVKVARSMRKFVRVWLMPAQPSSNLALEKIAYYRMSAPDLLSRGIADRGAQAGVPAAHRAPVGCLDVTPRFTGAFGRRI